MISFCVTPSMLLEATVLMGRESFPSLGNQGSWVSRVLEIEPSRATDASDGGDEEEEDTTGDPSISLLHVLGQCPHLPCPPTCCPLLSVRVEHQGIPSSASTRMHPRYTRSLKVKGKTHLAPGSPPPLVVQPAVGRVDGWLVSTVISPQVLGPLTLRPLDCRLNPLDFSQHWEVRRPVLLFCLLSQDQWLQLSVAWQSFWHS